MLVGILKQRLIYKFDSYIYLSGHLLNDCMGISRLITAVDVEIYSKVHLTLFFIIW